MIVRTATSADAPDLAAIYAPIVTTTAISFEEDAPSADDMAARIGAARDRHPWLVAADDADRAIGYAYAGPHRYRAAYRWAVDVSAYVAESARSRGIGKRLYAALLRVLAAQGFFRAYAGIALPNEASIALHRAAGFSALATYRNVGFKAGAWRDVAWYECELATPAGKPREPLSLGEIDLADLLRG